MLVCRPGQVFSALFIQRIPSYPYIYPTYIRAIYLRHKFSLRWTRYKLFHPCLNCSKYIHAWSCCRVSCAFLVYLGTINEPTWINALNLFDGLKKKKKEKRSHTCSTMFIFDEHIPHLPWNRFGCQDHKSASVCVSWFVFLSFSGPRDASRVAVIIVRRNKKEVKEGDRAGLIALKIYSKVSSSSFEFLSTSK